MSDELKRHKMLCAIMFALACMMMPFISAHAHKVMVFALAEDGRIHAQGYFADGKKAQDSLIEVFDPQGTKLLEGRTDKEGSFSFEIPEKSSLKIVLSASMGHKAQFIVPEEEIDPSLQEKNIPNPDVEQVRKRKDMDLLGPEQIRTIVDEELDKKLDPIIRAVLRSQAKGPSIHDVLGGIGYIVGIMGIIMYFRSKRNNQK
jgi:nickel transport protein